MSARMEVVGCTVKPNYSGHIIWWTPCNSGHIFVEPAESQSNSHRRKLI